MLRDEAEVSESRPGAPTLTEVERFGMDVSAIVIAVGGWRVGESGCVLVVLSRYERGIRHN